MKAELPGRWLNDRGEVWLNVGSGSYVERGFVNFDNHVLMPLRKTYPLISRLLPTKRAELVRKLYEADRRAVFVRWDCRRPLQLPTASVDHILCSHFLEHVYPVEARAVVSGFLRVLKPEATLHIIVPDLRSLADEYVASRGDHDAADRFIRETLLSNERIPSVRYKVLEFLGFEGLQHRWMYDSRSLSQLLLDTGFQLLEEETTTPSAHVRRDDGAASLHILAQKPPHPSLVGQSHKRPNQDGGALHL